ncbi:unnamed protein product [Prorocentrum cordatum]|uniref:Uncharacterized protein n=1 Tax=Prorocentrum cordatum TaxID=2364126 RepID=A0ABN9XDX6_9DINO|nr:unnamed protein product [Polarella glacialis]
MVGLRSDIACLLQIRIQVLAVASWNSTDMTYKKSADMKEQAQKLKDLNDVKTKAGYIDSLLKGNQTILQISNYQLNSPPKCGTDTGGSCWIIPCRSRHATCSSDSKCVCSAGTCAQHGVCVQRLSPLLLLASPSAEPPAQPAAAGLVLLSAAALAATALLAARRRHTPEVHLPVDVLG